MFAKPYLFVLLVLCTFGLHAQHSIIASEVESWVTQDMPPSDFNLNSAYVYLLNPQSLEDVFEGDELSRSERKDLDIKKGDYPQYMYLGVSIKNPMDPANTLTIPLMIHDVKDPNNSSRLLEYGGRFLENIPDEVLKDGDIVAKVKFEAFKGNSSNEFWKKAAEISVDLGKTATNLLQAPLTGSFVALTSQIIPQVDQGLRSMENVEDPQRITSEFYIRLLNKELSALYQERVVSATLYRIHWDVDDPPKARFFRNPSFNTVDEVRDRVTHNNTPFILVVNTKSEYNTDHSELAYNQSYLGKKTRDFRKIRNVEKKEIEKEFLEVLKTAIELQAQIDEFKSSLNTKYPDWYDFSRVIDLYYDLLQLKNTQMVKLNNTETFIRDKYTRLYSNVQNDVDLWFDSEMLGKARSIANFLVEHQGPYSQVATAKTARQIYADIELLDFFRDRARQTEIQGKLPKEIESLESFQRTQRKLYEMENALFQREFQVDTRQLGPEAQKSWLMDKATRSYPLCQICAEKVGEEITRIDNRTHEQNIQKYRDISTRYYQNLSCFDQVFTRLDEVIKTNQDSLMISPFMLDALEQDRQELINLSNTFTSIMGKDYLNMAPEELSDILSTYAITREKLNAIIKRLRGRVVDPQEAPCLLDVRP